MNNDFLVKFTSHNDKYSYSILPISRLNDSLKLISQTFYPFENVSISTGVAENPKAMAELNKLLEEIVKDGVSTVAVNNETNEIIGVSFNKIQRRPKPGETSLFEKFRNERCKEKESATLIQVMIDCEAQVDLFQYFNAEKLLKLGFLSVHPNYRKQGIACELIMANLKLLAALNKNFRGPNVATVLCSSNYSAKIAEKLGFQVLSETCYDNMEYNGIKLSKRIDNKHKSIKLVGKKLET